MGKALQDYIKYSKKELESYIQTEESCVQKVNSNFHISVGPYVLSDFKHALFKRIVRQKVGYYDAQLNGLILDIKNVKVLDSKAAIRFEDPRLHMNINADCYVFCPQEGAILTGVVKHIGKYHIGVIIYRVFNVSLRFSERLKDIDIEMDQEVKFRINSYNLENVFPYIDGELVTVDDKGHIKSLGIGKKGKSDLKQPAIDSDTEERENPVELDELLSLIKQEPVSDGEAVSSSEKSPAKASKPKKRKLNNDAIKQTSELQRDGLSQVKVKIEAEEETKKKKGKSKARA